MKESNSIIDPFMSFADPDMLFDNQVLTIKGTARLLKYSQKTVYRLARSGEIPCKRVGREYRFLLSDLIDWMKGAK